jgi:hypothetical protein
MRRLLAVSALTLAAGIALAQGPGPGAGPGKGPGGGWQFGPGNTRGWSMMTPDERNEHRSRMLGATTLAECQAVLEEHRKLIEQRAKERGVATPPGPRTDMCERMKARGRIG